MQQLETEVLDGSFPFPFLTPRCLRFEEVLLKHRRMHDVDGRFFTPALIWRAVWCGNHEVSLRSTFLLPLQTEHSSCYRFSPGCSADNRVRASGDDLSEHSDNAPATVDMRAASCLHARKSPTARFARMGQLRRFAQFSAAQSHSYCQKWQFRTNGPYEINIRTTDK